MSEQVQDADNSTIRALRDQAAKLEADLKAEREAKTALETQFNATNERLTALEREKMSEIERITAESTDWQKRAAEGEKHKERAARLEEWAQSTYESKIAALPDEIRPHVEKLTGSGDWSERLSAFEGALALVDTVKPKQFGSQTNPRPPAEGGGAGKPEFAGMDPTKVSLADVRKAGGL